MMERCTKYLLVILALIIAGTVSGQDPHFTQLHRIPAWYNPAASGYNVEHVRLSMLYRNQWSSVASPFKTQALVFDKQVSRVGFGANLVNNTAGEAGIRQLFLNGQLSYRLDLDKHAVSGGVQIGLIQKSFDPSKMTFDDQYTQDQGFNPSQPTTETFSFTKLTRPDFGLGLQWSYGSREENLLTPFAGMSVQHLNTPSESFIEENNAIPRKLVLHGGVGIRLAENVDVQPMVLYQQQQFAKELMTGAVVRLSMEDRNLVEGGLYFRNKDALALYAGYQWYSLMLGMSYDVNVSGITGGPGAFELTMTYVPKAREKKKSTKNPVAVKKPARTSTPVNAKNQELPATLNAKPAVKTAPANVTTNPTAPIREPGSVKTSPVQSAKTPVVSSPDISSPVRQPVPVPDRMSLKSVPTILVPAATSAIPVSIPVPVHDVLPDSSISTDDAEAIDVMREDAVKMPSRTASAIIVMPVASETPLRTTLPVHTSLPDTSLSTDTWISDGKNDSITGAPLRSTARVVHDLITAQAPLKVEVPEHDVLPVQVDTVEEDAADVMLPMQKQDRISIYIPRISPDQPIRASVPSNTLLPLIEESSITGGPLSAMHDSVQNTTEPVSFVTERLSNPMVSALAGTDAPLVPPTADTDSDGIIDVEDPCPYMKGTVVSGGCPDTDLDGITDMQDPCPMLPGSPGGKGCPESEMSPVSGRYTAQHFGNIEFKTASDKVHGLYKLDIIEPALDSLFNDVNLFLVITGHTDNEGNEQYNMQLSQARADVVRDIFIRKGLDEGRISTVAYGENMPLKNNVTESGRQHNRRVEVHVLRRKQP